MTICAVNGCSNRSSRRDPAAPSVSFYCLPKVISHQCERTRELSEKRRRLWLEKINRRDLYFKRDVRICSMHFVSGKPAYLMHDNHPDWLPTLKLGQENSPKSRSRRAKKEPSGKQEEGTDKSKEVVGSSQAAMKRISGKDKSAGLNEAASLTKATSKKQAMSHKKVASNIALASSKRTRSNTLARSVVEVAEKKRAAEHEEVADNTEVAAQGLLELAGMRTKEETGLSAVQEWLKLYDNDTDMEQETGVSTQTPLRMRDIVALELECRNLRRQLRDLREKKPNSSSG